LQRDDFSSNRRKTRAATEVWDVKAAKHTSILAKQLSIRKAQANLAGAKLRQREERRGTGKLLMVERGSL
jgi:hypothetical protein